MHLSCHGQGGLKENSKCRTTRLFHSVMKKTTRSARTAAVHNAPDRTRETAAALGIPEATVRTRFFRARSLLRESLSRELDVALGDAFHFAGARCDRITDAVMTRLEPSAG
jgi:RNA polymerase sigma-70 factor (ECF subfamily)